MSDSFFDSKYNLDPSVQNLPSNVTFFPDMKEFEDLSSEEEKGCESLIPSDWELKKIGAFQSKIETIQRKMDLLYSKRGNFPMSKISAHEVFGLANEVFGYNGWSSQVVDFGALEENFEDAPGEGDTEALAGSFSAKFFATIRVTLRDGFWNEHNGIGEAGNLPSKHLCYSKCKKEAVTDGIKKALIGFRLALLDYERIKKEEGL